MTVHPRKIGHAAVLLVLAAGFFRNQAAAQASIESVSGHDAIAGEVLIKLQPGSAALLQQIAQDINAEQLQVLAKSGTVRIKSRTLNASSLVQRLGNNPWVQWVEPNYVLHVSDTLPNDPFFTSNQLWNLQNTGQVINNNTGVPGADIKAV